MTDSAGYRQQNHSPDGDLISVWRGLLRMTTLGLALAGVLGACGSLNLLFDLCAHFRGQYLGLAAVLAILLWRSKSPRWAGVALLVLVHNAILVGPYYLPSRSAEKSTAKLTLVSFNVHTANRRSAEVLDYLRAKNPDLILLIEVDDRWVRELEELQKTHPHTVISPRSDNFGIALFSKIPIERQEVFGLWPDRLDTIWAEFDLSGQRFAFMGIHPLPPMRSRAFEIRNEQLSDVAKRVISAHMPKIVAGDFNATPWCVGFQPLRDAGLIDTALGFGVQRTWNSKLPLMRIPIDHVLATKEFVTVRRAVGPACGSDHYAVEAELALTK